MDYEDKYKEALEKAEDMEYLFPELKESEDERIRNVLVDYFKRYKEQEECGIKTFYGIPTDNIIAWLEKQGEQKLQGKPALEAINEEKVDNQNCAKSANKVEPKFKVKYADNEYNVLEVKDIAGVTFYGIEDEPNHIDYVKEQNCEIISCYAIKENGSPYPTKPAVFSEQNPAWSKEDENGLGDALWAIQQAKTIAKDENDMGNLWYAERWLKSLKDRVKTQQEWTMQDEEELQIALDTLVKAGQHSSAKWLKNVCLVPQNKWKPSDEQMKILLSEVTSWKKGCSKQIVLESLYQDLKKL